MTVKISKVKADTEQNKWKQLQPPKQQFTNLNGISYFLIFELSSLISDNNNSYNQNYVDQNVSFDSILYWSLLSKFDGVKVM